MYHHIIDEPILAHKIFDPLETPADSEYVQRANASVMAKKWGMTTRRVRQLCAAGKIFKAKRNLQGVWTIPITADAPVDGRQFRYQKPPVHFEQLVRHVEARLAELGEHWSLDDYWHHFVLGATYHLHVTGKSRLSRAEVFATLVDNVVLRGEKGATQQEVRHFAAALEQMRSAVKANRRLTYTLFREWLLTLHGKRRARNDWMVDERSRMAIETVLRMARSKRVHPLVLAGDVLNRMFKRRPLTRYNEQMGFLLANFVLLRHGYPPAIVYRVIFTQVERYLARWQEWVEEMRDPRYAEPPPQTERAFINACVIRAVLRAVNFLRFSH